MKSEHNPSIEAAEKGRMASELEAINLQNALSAFLEEEQKKQEEIDGILKVEADQQQRQLDEAYYSEKEQKTTVMQDLQRVTLTLTPAYYDTVKERLASSPVTENEEQAAGVAATSAWDKDPTLQKQMTRTEAAASGKRLITVGIKALSTPKAPTTNKKQDTLDEQHRKQATEKQLASQFKESGMSASDADKVAKSVVDNAEDAHEKVKEHVATPKPTFSVKSNKEKEHVNALARDFHCDQYMMQSGFSSDLLSFLLLHSAKGHYAAYLQQFPSVQKGSFFGNHEQMIARMETGLLEKLNIPPDVKVAYLKGEVSSDKVNDNIFNIG